MSSLSRFKSNPLKEGIDQFDLPKIKNLISENPTLVNLGIDNGSGPEKRVHPLHYLSDCVFAKRITDIQAVEIGKILIAANSNINGNTLVIKQDTPLIAACSLHADSLAIALIQSGAILAHQGCHGGTALHWAAWTGADRVVKELLKHNLDLEQKDLEFDSTALFWAIHGLKNGGANNLRNQVECAKMLVEAGAKVDTTNKEGVFLVELFDHEKDKRILEYLGLKGS